MPSRKRKHDQVDLGLNDLSADVDGFAVAFNPSPDVSPSPSTYHNPFDSRLDLDYAVVWEGNTEQWNEIKSYKKFQVTGDNGEEITIPVDSFVYVRGLPQTEPISRKNAKKARKNRDRSEDTVSDYQTWVAHVLECRAADPQHVYLRVAWLYWPDELQGFGGRRHYHGDREVIPSNDMQLINAIAVRDRVEVKHWNDLKRPKYPDDSHYTLFWRQTLDVRSKSSPFPRLPKPMPSPHCICNEPANPDDEFVYCVSCDRWMHAKCIEDTAIELAAQRAHKDVQDTEESNGIITPENPPGLIARLVHKVHKVRRELDNTTPPEKYNETKTEESDKASESVSTPNGASHAPSSKTKNNKTLWTPQRRKNGMAASKLRQPSFEAKLGEPKSNQPDCGPATVILSKHEIDGTTKIWEQPICCLFEDCGNTIS